MKRTDLDKELWEIRDILYDAVQRHIANDPKEAESSTKEAYQRLATLLDRAQSNLKPPDSAPADESPG